MIIRKIVKTHIFNNLLLSRHIGIIIRQNSVKYNKILEIMAKDQNSFLFYFILYFVFLGFNV